MKTRFPFFIFLVLTGFFSRAGHCQLPVWIAPGRELAPAMSMSGFYQTAESGYDFKGNQYPVGNYQHWSLAAAVWFPVTDQVVLYGQFPVWQNYSVGGSGHVLNDQSSGIGDPVGGMAYLILMPSWVLMLAGEMTLPLASTGRFDNPVPLGSGELKYALRVQLTSGSKSESWIWKLSASGVRRDLNRNHEGITGGAFYYPLLAGTLIGVDMTYQFPIGKIESTDPAINGFGNGVSGLTVIPSGLFTFPSGYGVQIQMHLPITGTNRVTGTGWMTRLLVPL